MLTLISVQLILHLFLILITRERELVEPRLKLKLNYNVETSINKRSRVVTSFLMALHGILSVIFNYENLFIVSFLYFYMCVIGPQIPFEFFSILVKRTNLIALKPLKLTHHRIKLLIVYYKLSTRALFFLFFS